ncbi:hypothetical protein SDC9_164505 [bioreactor metagenome]|uniref:Uncharacterized protein n=1 Tax=bioreactor metagenome TaxID=1076179 RepID=A0A645FRT3_9ZZZZ
MEDKRVRHAVAGGGGRNVGVFHDLYLADRAVDGGNHTRVLHVGKQLRIERGLLGTVCKGGIIARGCRRVFQREELVVCVDKRVLFYVDACDLAAGGEHGNGRVDLQRAFAKECFAIINPGLCQIWRAVVRQRHEIAGCGLFRKHAGCFSAVPADRDLRIKRKLRVGLERNLHLFVAGE